GVQTCALPPRQRLPKPCRWPSLPRRPRRSAPKRRDFVPSEHERHRPRISGVGGARGSLGFLGSGVAVAEARISSNQLISQSTARETKRRTAPSNASSLVIRT